MAGGPSTDLFGVTGRANWPGRTRICGRPMGKTFSAVLVRHYIGLDILSTAASTCPGHRRRRDDPAPPLPPGVQTESHAVPASRTAPRDPDQCDSAVSCISALDAAGSRDAPTRS
jgi:hypothetical protein